MIDKRNYYHNQGQSISFGETIVKTRLIFPICYLDRHFFEYTRFMERSIINPKFHKLTTYIIDSRLLFDHKSHKTIDTNKHTKTTNKHTHTHVHTN